MQFNNEIKAVYLTSTCFANEEETNHKYNPTVTI